MDIESGFDARITLSGNTTITLSNTQNGLEGVITVTGGASSYNLTITGRRSDGLDTHSIPAGETWVVGYHISGGNLYLNIKEYY